jgi:hemerythrin superfamily protein
MATTVLIIRYALASYWILGNSRDSRRCASLGNYLQADCEKHQNKEASLSSCRYVPVEITSRQRWFRPAIRVIEAERKGNTLHRTTGTRSFGLLFGGVAAGIVASRLLPPVVATLKGRGRTRAGANPFDQLIDDHREILSLLDSMLELPEPSRVRKTRLYMMLKRKLAKHALAEEDVIYPLVRNDSASGDERRHLYDQHADMKILLHQTGEMLRKGEAWNETVGMLRSLIREHAEEEEKTIFPELSRELKEIQWPKISGQISREEALIL